jgi:hypothetical protein
MSTTNFDFKAFNAMTRDTAAGMKLALAEGLLKDALYSLERYNNPLSDGCNEALNELKTFRIKYKAAAEERKAQMNIPVSGITN